ncbi:ATP phosphoribosyltransferase regulatory subunit [Vulcanibacillus modesticaldus]|uniref:ATP phosphoribosyltransferase regulatory subunit n=1 Tax=Vulcanibacillus modesticaldus TaxID=337097 RepID=A0A1D2YVC4_9BACI|nr:ATP phosphoribosyltransferase regulatory subunit [Vulcanibacillus modesticaldus]OEF99566.1 ATP phosphoribosyltransferase regulatory subunit [Vulcanibacillus modesticaldus]
MEFIKIEDEINYSKKRFQLSREIEDLFIEKSFSPINPTLFEDYESFISVNKRVKEESVVKFIHGAKILVLRPDITMNIIKNIIPRLQDNAKLKIFYNATIFKNFANLNIKEVRQMGVEYLGESSINAEREVIELALKVLKKYSDDFILEIGNSKYLNGLFNELKISREEKDKLKNLIYKKSKFELINYLKTLGLPEEKNEILINIFRLQGSINEITNLATNYFMNEEMMQAINELITINDFCEKNGLLKNIHFDLSMITELDYYEGIIFKGFYPSSNSEIISGGRYDALTKIFGKKVPAIGFSVDLDELVRTFYVRGENS